MAPIGKRTRNVAKHAERMQRKRASLAQASRGGAGGAGSDTGDAGASPWQHASGLPVAKRRGDDCKLGWLLQIWSICHHTKFGLSAITSGAINTHGHESDLVLRGARYFVVTRRGRGPGLNWALVRP